MISSLFIGSLTPAQCAAAAPPSVDAGARPRRAVATAAAILVHAAAIALVLVKFPIARNPVETAAIDVEVVREAAPKPKAEPEPPPPPAAEAQPERPRVSGGESDLTPGKPPEVALPLKPAPAQRPARPAPKKKPAPVPAPALSEAPSPDSIPAPAAPSPAAKPALIPAPSLHPPPPKWWNTGPNPGEGGGDPYLNAVRDGILSRFLYPPEARDLGLSGTAQYQITLDRQGNLIGLQLIQSAGSSVLDAAGLDTIRRAAPFGPVPPDVIGDRVGLIFTLHIAPASSSAE